MIVGINLMSCVKTRQDADNDAWTHWEDSVKETTFNPSFKGVALNDLIPYSEDIDSVVDIVSVDYSLNGVKATEKTVYRTLYTLKGKVYKIDIETGNDDVIKTYESYLSRLFNDPGCEHLHPSGRYVFKNGSVTYHVQHNEGNIDRYSDDMRLHWYFVYKFSLTDSIGLKRCMKYAETLQRKREERQKQIEEDKKRKNDSLNAILERQF